MWMGLEGYRRRRGSVVERGLTGEAAEESSGIGRWGGSAQVVTLSASGFTKKRKISSMGQLRKAVRVKSYLATGRIIWKRWRGLGMRGEKKDPCSFVGYEVKTSSDAILIGSGDYEKCALGLKKQIQKMLTEDGKWEHEIAEKPC